MGGGVITKHLTDTNPTGYFQVLDELVSRGNENLHLRSTADQREPLVLGRFLFSESGHRVWAFRTMTVCPSACSGSTNDILTARGVKRRLPLNKAF
jgi:hypothetical protein